MPDAQKLGGLALEMDDDTIRSLKTVTERVVKVTETSVIIEVTPDSGKTIVYRVPKTLVSEDEVVRA